MVFKQDSVVISTGILKYHSIPLNGTKNPKYHSKYHSKSHSDTIQIPLAIIPLGPFKYHSNTTQKPMVFECYLNDPCKGCDSSDSDGVGGDGEGGDIADGGDDGGGGDIHVKL